jgi:hypothetical protein
MDRRAGAVSGDAERVGLAASKEGKALKIATWRRSPDYAFGSNRPTGCVDVPADATGDGLAGVLPSPKGA